MAKGTKTHFPRRSSQAARDHQLAEDASESGLEGPPPATRMTDGRLVLPDEEAQHMGENGPCQPNVVLPIHLDRPVKELDEKVRRVFDHASAMLRSLASAAKIVELVRDIYDEYLREHRLKSGLPVEPGPAGVREEQL